VPRVQRHSRADQPTLAVFRAPGRGALRAKKHRWMAVSKLQLSQTVESAPSVSAKQKDHLAPEIRLEGTDVDFGLTFVAEQLEYGRTALFRQLEFLFT